MGKGAFTHIATLMLVFTIAAAIFIFTWVRIIRDSILFWEYKWFWIVLFCVIIAFLFLGSYIMELSHEKNKDEEDEMDKFLELREELEQDKGRYI